MYRGIMSLSWSDIELSWKLHLPEHLLRIITYKWERSYSFIKSFLLPLIFPCAQFILLRQYVTAAMFTSVRSYMGHTAEIISKKTLTRTCDT